MKREMPNNCATRRATRKMSACAASGEVFGLHLPSRARHSPMSVREKSKNDGLAKTFLQSDLPSMPILSFLPFDVVLAIVGVLPIVANSTMSLTMTMTTAPVFHRYDSIVGNLLGVESVIANQWVFVGIFVVEECKRLLVLVGEPSMHVMSLHLCKKRA